MTLHEKMFMKKNMQIERKLSWVCIAKKLWKVGGIHRIKLLVKMRDNIELCKSIFPDVTFQMKNSLQEFVKSKNMA